MNPFTRLSLRTIAAATLIGIFGHAALCGADVRMPRIFGDHMVLQQSAKFPVWGMAEPGEKVSVEFAGQTAIGVAGDDGAWRVDLQPVAADAAGRQLIIRGRNVVEFEDVVVGDVWIAAGQSNMEFGLQIADGGRAAIDAADDRSLRMFIVPYAAALTPQPDVAVAPGEALEGKWQVCTPQVMGARWGSNGFSAVGYFFARDLRAKTGRPVGVIGCYKGGTAAQAWVSLRGLQQDAALAEFVKRQRQWADGFAAAARTFPAKQADYVTAAQKWDAEVRPAFMYAMTAWNAAVKQAAATGDPVPPKPVPSKPRPQPPVPPDGGYFGPANLFNGMVAPLIPYAMTGVIWYQGESNTSTLSQALQYETLFGRLIADWRDHWQAGAFPFIYVQLAAYQPAPNAGQGNWIWLRESQSKVLKVPNTAMVSAVDIGDPLDPHPKDKADVGHRLALAARRIVYGETVAAYGPVFEGMKIEGQAIRLTFAEVNGGLVIGVPPWTAPSVRKRPADHLDGFVIAGNDRIFVPASARFDGDTVVVTSNSVTQPAAVRYNWADSPSGNLYNRAGLPAAPFRTDDWPAESETSQK